MRRQQQPHTQSVPGTPSTDPVSNDPDDIDMLEFIRTNPRQNQTNPDDPEKFIKNLPTGFGETINPTRDGILGRIKREAVFFYPACGFDWTQIKRFTDRCSLFVYCDWHTTVEAMAQAMLQVPMNNPALNALRCDWANATDVAPRQLVDGAVLERERPGFLHPDELARYRGSHNAYANKHPWGRLVHVIHTVDGQDRRLDLLYLCAEGVTAYLSLFSARLTAPKFLCIVNCGAGFGFNWTDFRGYEMPLGRAVAGSRRKPEFLVCDAGHDWPWSESMPGDGGGVFRRPPRP